MVRSLLLGALLQPLLFASTSVAQAQVQSEAIVQPSVSGAAPAPVSASAAAQPLASQPPTLSSTNSSQAAAASVSFKSTILVLARDLAAGNDAASGFNAYGIPYQVVVVPQEGTTLPSLNSSTTSGNYGGIMVLGELAYSYPEGWASALTTAQWQQIYDYQETFGARLVRIDAYPSAQFGTSCCIRMKISFD